MDDVASRIDLLSTWHELPFGFRHLRAHVSRGRFAWFSKPTATILLVRITKQAGVNAVFSRLEIANDPPGDVELLKRIKPGQKKPSSLKCCELVQPSARLAKQLGLHFFYMLDPAASKANINDGFRDNPRRYNNGEDELYDHETDPYEWKNLAGIPSLSGSKRI